MRVRKKMMLAAAAVLMLACVSGTYGYFSDIVSVTNHIATGDVHISLKEYELKNGTEISYEDPKVVLPGETISKIPRITNYAAPCWVRARISYENEKEELEGLADSNILGISEEWIKRGEYYYYADVLEHGETVTLFQAVEIPAQWTEAHSDQKLKINIQADAIQAANFQPDFSAMSPWGNQEIELCIHEENGEIVSKQQKTELSVEFNGSAHKLAAVPDDFFANIGTAMPGDTFQDSIEISNTTENPAELFFHTGIVCQREDRMDLLRKLQLTISMNEKTIYSGDLLAEDLKEEISLGTFEPGESGTMEFTVSVPASLNNDYALRDASVRWYFTVYEQETALSVTPSVSRLPENPDTYVNKADADTAAPVKTGDESPILMFFVLLVISMVMGAAILIVQKGGRKQ